MNAAESGKPLLQQEGREAGIGKGAAARIYTHPIRGYTVAVPPLAQVFEKGEDASQVSIRSRKGYAINLQSGGTRRGVPLVEMPRLLEREYLGPGKPWTHRGHDRNLTVAGLPAYEVLYEGRSTRARVVIVRGRSTDFVFIFFAAEREYQKLEHEFDWVLTHFRPGPVDLPDPQEVFSTKAREFRQPSYGYSILYPTEWVVANPANMTTMFSGREGSIAHSAIVSIQNVQPPGAGDSESAARLALEDLKSSLSRAVRKISASRDAPWTYSRDELTLNGREMVFSYLHAGQKFRKRIIVVPRPFEPIAHIWSYTAPEETYEAFSKIADRMLKSWVILATRSG